MNEAVVETLTENTVRVIRPRSRVIAVTTCEGRLAGDPKTSVEKARMLALQWLADRSSGHPLPAHAYKFEPFEIDVPPVPVAAARLKTDKLDYWVGRLHDADKTVAGRQWATEITVASTQSGDAIFGMRHQCIVPPNDPGFRPTAPRILRDIAFQIGLVQNGVTVNGKPWVIQTDEEMERLLALLTSPERHIPVYTITTPNHEQDPEKVFIDASRVAQLTSGVAFTVVLPARFTYALTRRFGKVWGVYDGAVRTYRPGFDPDSQAPRQHPLTLSGRLTESARRFEDLLIGQAIEVSSTNLPTSKHPPSFIQVRQASAQQRVLASQADNAPMAVQLAAAKAETAAIAASAEETLELAVRLEQEKNDLLSRLNDQAREIWGLQSRIQHLEASRSVEGLEREPYPSTWEEMEEWANKELAGRLLFTPRAIRSLKKAEYENIEQVYKALDILAHDYRDMRLGQVDRKKFDEKLTDAQLELSPTGDEGHLSGFGDEYFVKHRGVNRFFENHLRGGRGREPRTCLRIYFWFDTDESLVVIGDLPKHLRNSLT